MARRKPSFFDIFRTPKVSYQNLAKFNMAIAAVAALEAIALLLLSDSSKGIVSITTNYLSNDVISSSNAGGNIMLPASQHLFDLHLSYAVAAVLLAVGVGRWTAAIYRRKQYEAGLRKGISLHTWVEHGAVLTLLMVTVGLLSGVWDLVSIFFIVWLAGLAAWLGYKFNAYSIKNKLNDQQLLAVALKAGLWIWLIIALYLAGALIWGRGLPSYVYWIYASIFLIGIGFAYNGYCSFKQNGRWSDKLWGERVYGILSLVAASALAWQVFFGTLR